MQYGNKKISRPQYGGKNVVAAYWGAKKVFGDIGLTPEKVMITFNFVDLNNNQYSYQAEEGMTWEEFCKSAYNDGTFSIYNRTARAIKPPSTIVVLCSDGGYVRIRGHELWVTNTSLIINNYTYYSMMF